MHSNSATVLDLTFIRGDFTLKNVTEGAAAAAQLDLTSAESVFEALHRRGFRSLRLDRRPADKEFVELAMRHGLYVEFSSPAPPHLPPSRSR